MTSFQCTRCPRHGLKEGLSAEEKSLVDRSRVDSVLSADTAAPRRANEQLKRLEAPGQSASASGSRPGDLDVSTLRAWTSIPNDEIDGEPVRFTKLYALPCE